MRPHRWPEGDHSDFMERRRAESPHLFSPHGSYKRWLHLFQIQRDRSGASVNQNTHHVLPWELETDVFELDLAIAHWNLHGCAHWHPMWRDWMRRAAAPGSGPDFWALMPDPSIAHLCRWLADKKRCFRVAGRLKDDVEYMLQDFRIKQPTGD